MQALFPAAQVFPCGHFLFSAAHDAGARLRQRTIRTFSTRSLAYRQTMGARYEQKVRKTG
jgi:hypothetical protein